MKGPEQDERQREDRLGSGQKPPINAIRKASDFVRFAGEEMVTGRRDLQRLKWGRPAPEQERPVLQAAHGPVVELAFLAEEGKAPVLSRQVAVGLQLCNER